METAYYRLQIYNPPGVTHGQISHALSLIPFSQSNEMPWIYELRQDASTPSVDFIKVFSDILKERYEALQSLGISKADMAIFALYQGQCNTEFSVESLKILSDIGVVFCISCWEGNGEYEEGHPSI